MTKVTFAFRHDPREWRRARERFSDIRSRASNTQAAWETFLDWFAHNNRLQFGSRGARWRTPWQELAPSTVRAKRAAGYTGDILVRETDLLRSIADRPLAVERVGAHDMEAGTDLPYARAHHHGVPRRRLPRRPLWSVRQIRREGALGSALSTWIATGRARVDNRRAGL